MKTILLWIVLFISAVFPIQAAAQENPAVQLETQENIPAPISVERKISMEQSILLRYTI